MSGNLTQAGRVAPRRLDQLLDGRLVNPEGTKRAELERAAG